MQRPLSEQSRSVVHMVMATALPVPAPILVPLVPAGGSRTVAVATMLAVTATSARINQAQGQSGAIMLRLACLQVKICG